MDVRYEIEQLVTQHLQRARLSGPDNMSAVCPFHTRADGSAERNPSFAININTGLFFCQACGAKGNLYLFLKHLGLSTSDIETGYRNLIDEASKKTPKAKSPVNANLFSNSPIEERLLGLFDYCPKSLTDAGFTPETLRYFEVGFDKWNNRITFPLRDLGGKLVAVSGRSIHSDVNPRYKIYTEEYVAWNLPARQRWEKSDILYNAYRLYAANYQDPNPSDLILVEGFKACMWVHQAGFPNVCALVGSHLSDPQRWILEHIGSTVYLFLDNNDAGWKGARQAGNVLSKSMRVRVMLYPERLRDDDHAQPDNCTPEEIRQQKETALDWYSYKALL